MGEALIYLATSFWLGAVHAATPGHGKTIAAAYIVGVRGKPVDAWILGIFVTLSHTSGIVLVGLLASLGLPGFLPQRIEAWLALAHRSAGHRHRRCGRCGPSARCWRRRGVPTLPQDRCATTHDPAPAHTHDHGQAHAPHGHDHGHAHEHDMHTTMPSSRWRESGYHSHGWGFQHTHDMSLVTSESAQPVGA